MAAFPISALESKNILSREESARKPKSLLFASSAHPEGAARDESHVRRSGTRSGSDKMTRAR